MFLVVHIVVNGVIEWLLLFLVVVAGCVFLRVPVPVRARGEQSMGMHGRRRRPDSRGLHKGGDASGNRGRRKRPGRFSPAADTLEQSRDVSGSRPCLGRHSQNARVHETGTDSDDMIWVLKQFYNGLGEEEEHNMSCYSAN
jgi:hypothetical protein